MKQKQIREDGRTVLKIGGMTCAACVNSIQKQVSSLDGVNKCEVNLGAEKAVIEYDPSKTDITKMENAVKEAGFKVVYEKLKLKIAGLMDSSDANRLEQKLATLDGIKFVSVNYGNGQINIEYNQALISLGDIRKIITDGGYDIISEDLSTPVEEIEARKTKRLFVLGVIFTIPIAIFGHFTQFFVSIPFARIDEIAYLMFACAAIVQIGIGWRFYVGAFKMARLKSANMDTLIVLGTTTAFVFSAINTFPTPVWENIHYSAAVMVITFILLGKYLENKTKGKASSTIRKLLELQPKMAKIKKDEKEIETPVELLKQNDIMIIRPGEKIPVDGVIVEGVSALDESMVTGESIPTNKTKGDQVIGGTVNKEGALLVKATKVGGETFLSQVVSLVEDAMGKKPPMQRLVDKIAGYFAFMVIGIAVVTFLAWYAFGAPGLIMAAIIPTVAVLVVACPCALGLATPTAVMVGMGKAAQHGVIFKGGQGLEMLGKINTIVFDKTGTLTKGEPQVTDVISLQTVKNMSAEKNIITENQVLKLAAIAEKNSEHPLSRSVISKAEQSGFIVQNPSSFSSIPGGGVKSTYNNQEILVGNLPLIEKQGIDAKILSDSISKLQIQGKTVSVVVVDKEIIGLIAFLDTPKPAARETIQDLQKMGINVAMLTGDNELTAKSVAKEIGIETVIANVLPADKAVEIERLQQQGNKVAMVGDGVNDAPALTQADVGVAIGSGTDIALEAGMVVLVRETLQDVVSAIEISKKTISKIKQNLFYAFVYNTILIPVAGVGWLYPALAGLAMAASSVSVVSSSLLLKRWNPRHRSPNSK